MKTLHLNLKRKWFDMILQGSKKEEYRRLSKYWFQRLFVSEAPKESPEDNSSTYEDFVFDINNFSVVQVMKSYCLQFEKYDSITFSNGYAKDRDQFVVELKSIEVRQGKENLGAEAGVDYFVLVLGSIISKNIK